MMISDASRPTKGSNRDPHEPRLDFGRRHRWLLLIGLLMTLPGCSGCQKKPVEEPPKVEEPATPPVAPVEEKPPEEKSDTAPTAEPSESETAAGGESEKSATATGGTPGSPTGGSKANSKSENAGTAGPKVGVAPRPATKAGTETSDPGTSSKAGRPPPTAEAALETAKNLQKVAAVAAELGNYGKAFDLSSQAWEAAHAFPDNSDCQTLCKELEVQLELWGDRANALVSPEDARTKKLVDQ